MIQAPGVNFTKQLFCTKVFFAQLLMCLQFGFVIFWRKDFGAKAARKMLVKLTTGPIFTTFHFPKLQMGLIS
jgi:hypothetical protein